MGLIGTVSEWIINNTASYIYGLMLNSPYNQLIHVKDKMQFEKVLFEYDKRFEEQFLTASRDEELDAEGLKAYTKENLFKGFLNVYLLEGNIIRKQEYNRIFEEACVAASATKREQKEQVRKYVTTLFTLLECFLLKNSSLEAVIRQHQLEDTLLEQVEQFRKEMEKNIRELDLQINKNTFAYMIDQIQPKETNDNDFHYLNDAIGFWGREKELEAFEDFLKDERAVLYTAVTAPGGCGKSKLVYEFTKRYKYDLDWEIQYLEDWHIEKLENFHDYYYPRNLVLIVDYAGVYAEKLGRWMNQLLRLKAESRPEKIRLILLEREGTINIVNETMEPTWKRTIENSGERKDRLKDIFFSKEPFGEMGELRPLPEDAIKEMMRQRGEMKGAQISDEILEQLYAQLNRLGTTGIASAKPLLALMITQSYIEKQNIFQWKSKDMLEYFLERYYKQCFYACGRDEKMLESVKMLVLFATVSGVIDIDCEERTSLEKELETISDLLEEQYCSLICAINQSQEFRNIILPMEPDILGEYFAIEKLKKMAVRKKHLQATMKELWTNSERCYSFFARCIHDYGNRAEFREFLLEHLDDLLPVPNSKNKIEMRSKLLHLMLITILGKTAQKILFEKMQVLYSENPKYVKVAEDYAAFLMLEYKNHLDDFSKQGENIERINGLRRKFPSSTYLDIIYGKTLYNQVVSYCNILRQQKTAERYYACKGFIDEYVDKLRRLCEDKPENEMVRQSYNKAIFSRNWWVRNK